MIFTLLNAFFISFYSFHQFILYGEQLLDKLFKIHETIFQMDTILLEKEGVMGHEVQLLEESGAEIELLGRLMRKFAAEIMVSDNRYSVCNQEVKMDMCVHKVKFFKKKDGTTLNNWKKTRKKRKHAKLQGRNKENRRSANLLTCRPAF
ncbi:hypothetical protein BpHYR1_035052 [Brachionus plicatilis]|uniref:Uncharacterized protein n=1 Tax=Brachionus plicatilis TaxID=10195 RepID=A0A3M7SZ06_BRAPC|nr:hypothetical protein BpHYR1_035052 [Brachionus plicatilis]